MTTIGTGTCPNCGLDGVAVKVSKKNHLYMVCLPAFDGGCDSQVFARGAHSDQRLAERVTKWSSREAKATWLNAMEPEPAPAPEPEPEDEPEELEDEQPPPAPRLPRRAPPRPAPKKPATRPKAQPAKKPGLFRWE